MKYVLVYNNEIPSTPLVTRYTYKLYGNNDGGHLKHDNRVVRYSFAFELSRDVCFNVCLYYLY